MYINKVEQLWFELQKRGLASKSFQTIKNSDIFKYSPYVTLTEEQSEVTYEIINDIITKLANNQKGMSIVNGGAGTGKTVLAINMIFTLLNALSSNVDIIENEEYYNIEQETFARLKKFVNEYGNLKIGFVVPMTSLRRTISKVFSLTKKGLKSSMVIGPSDVVKKNYDILFVDESHRLSQRKNITNMAAFDFNCNKLDIDKYTSTQLDWIIKCSNYQILFYDENQSIKASDMSIDQFKKSLSNVTFSTYNLISQLRCQGGQLYTGYINKIFDCTQISNKPIENYDFKYFDNLSEMITNIKSLDKNIGLCRNVAGYSWLWKSKNCISIKQAIDNKLHDIEIEGNKYVWNMSNQEWIIREGSVDEIGCIHTTQGYDLNYVGVIFGREIDYNFETNQIEVDLSKFYDTNVKRGTSSLEVKKYIINAYKVMMMRGIKGCYIYCCNENLRKYLKQFV